MRSAKRQLPLVGLGLSGWLDARWLDLRLAARLLAKRPAFATLAVLTLALGIGANTAIFSVVRGVLLRPLAFAEPERLAKVWPQTSHSKKRWAEYRETTRAFDDLALWSGWGAALTGDGEPEALIGAATSANLFEVLGVEPVLGRAFAADENQPGKTDVVVLSDRLWKRRFGADPGIVGRTITLDATAHTVIGVMPAGFRYPWNETEYWVPLPIAAELEDYSANYLQLVGRLAPGATFEQADDEVRRLVERIHEKNPDLAPSYGRDATVVSLREDLVGPFRPPLLLLLGAVAMVLLIAATNLAGLLLGRALERRREISMRAALGASRTRLVEHLRSVDPDRSGSGDLRGRDGGMLPPGLAGGPHRARRRLAARMRRRTGRSKSRLYRGGRSHSSFPISESVNKDSKGEGPVLITKPPFGAGSTERANELSESTRSDCVHPPSCAREMTKRPSSEENAMSSRPDSRPPDLPRLGNVRLSPA